ncbi:MAG: hypothetical protein IJ004_06695 [Clostridia bacterium]|nr:hypothetical protein [Clostridia bacterium]MBQ8840989.1 hypothetical protein [Clostridia bacterium]
MTLTIDQLVEKRHISWYQTRDIIRDSEICTAIADTILETKALREQILKKPYLLIEACFTVVDKNKCCVPFILNEVQRDFISQLEKHGTEKPYFILKGRQQGFTTLITAIQLAYAITTRNFSGFTLADREDNAKAIFIDKAKQMYSSLPERLKPTEKLNSASELFFERLNSSWRVATASSNIGRSRTLSFIHYSEVAFYKCPLSDLQKSIQEAATANALCVYETTANGFNEAKSLWDSGACVNLFYPWWKTAEYEDRSLEFLKKPTQWLKERLDSLKEIGLHEYQLAWYARKYFMYIDKSTIKQEYPCTAEEAFLSSGECLFDKEAISNYLSSFNVPKIRGVFTYDTKHEPIKDDFGNLMGFQKVITNIKFLEKEDGYISIVAPPYHAKSGQGEEKKPYVIGADTAGIGKDFFAAKVLDNTTGICVATLRKRKMDEDVFAKQLYCLGRYYNDALIAVETNYSRHPVRVLRKLGYPNIYLSKGKTNTQDRYDSYYGFLTTAVSRPIILANLVEVMRENIRLETDRVTLFEMLHFVRHSTGKYSACEGSHDDLIMASAIAHFVRSDFSQKIESFDTESSFLTNSFTFELPEQKDFMEW